MPARESIESLVSLKLSHRSSLALDMKLVAVGLASRYLKLPTMLVASSSVRHDGFGQPEVVVVLEDFEDVLECELVEVVFDEAVEDLLELLEVVEVTEVMVWLVEEAFEVVEEDFELVEENFEVIEEVFELADVFELVDDELLALLVAVTPQQEQALLYRAVPEHDDAYVGTAPVGQCDIKEVQSDLREVDDGCASVPVTALL